MPKLETFPDSGFFKIDNIPYQKGQVVVTCIGNYVGMDYQNGRNITAIQPFTQWVDENDIPYGKVDLLKEAIEQGCFL